MRYIFFSFFFFFYSFLHAQITWLDKPFLISTSLKQTVAYHIPYQETLMQLTQERTVAYKLLSYQENEVSIQSQVKKIKGKVIAFGQEQIFDSEKKDSLTTGERMLIDSILQPSVQTIGTAGKTKTSQLALISFEPEDHRKFFLAKKYLEARTAYNWKDTIQVDSSLSIYECTFLRKQADTLQVHVFGTHQIKNTIKQGDQNISQVIKGLETTMRFYNAKTGILIKEQRLIQFEGTAESQNTRFPVSIKLETLLKRVYSE